MQLDKNKTYDKILLIKHCLIYKHRLEREQSMSRKRQEIHQEALRTLILETAKKIVVEEGLNGLSIRKITTQMDYSPGIIYHYFKDKNAIVDALVFEGYMSIVKGISSVEPPEPANPELHIRHVMKRYVEIALEQRAIYRLFLLSDSPEILKHTTVLQKGISGTSLSMGLLTEQLRQGMATGIFKVGDPELTAQVLWSAVYGLVMKLIIESDVPSEQQEALINTQLDILLSGLSIK